ncbi:RICIN domain-containing protein [Streptomyces sp. NPDC047880]|uniref:RICIN domain-containing protein n=1 Tax=Streptomyces sp. NPDC047880 TaxID=3155626 RepID=UPI003456A4C2
MDRTTAIVILIMVSIVILGAIYFLLRTQQASTTTQTSVLGVSAAILGLLATYFTAILDEPDKAPKSAPAGGATSPSESSTIAPSPGDSGAAKHSPSRKSAPSTSHGVDGSASMNSPEPLEKSTNWKHISATKSPYKGLCLEAEGQKVVTATCRDSKAQLWTATDRGEIVNHDARCLTPEGFGGGQTMIAQVCNGSNLQKWEMREGRIWSDSLCLTIRGPYTDPGAAIQTWNTAEDPKPANEMYWSLSD